MAEIPGCNKELLEEWAKTRPPLIQDMIKRYPAFKLWRLKPSGHRVVIYAYNESGTVTVSVSGLYNRVLFERNVFGVSLDDLEECDLPAEDEDVGVTATEAGYTDEDVRTILIPRLSQRLKEQDNG